MKALSVRQPWAWAILNGKPVENRGWPTRFTGPFLIHASKTFDHAGYSWILDNRHLFSTAIPNRDDFKMGGIVGKAKMIDCVNSYDSPFFFGPWGFVLKDAKPLPFVQYPGKLNFFDIDDKVIGR